MKKLLLLVAGTSLALGCGTTRPPNELVAARSAYQHASSSRGAPLASNEMLDARRSLDAAEHSFADDGDTVQTKSLAYVASRRAISAEAKGDALKAVEDKRTAEAEFQSWKDAQALATKGQLEQTKSALSNAQRETESERQARIAADQKANDALTQIAGIQARQTERGLVLTLSGSVLFASGKSTLLPSAKKSLGDVANALKQDKRSFNIVGHTDSSGADEMNQRLSEARANAVRTYLVSQGIDGQRVRSEGAGETQPIADNSTPEGRANNRRVEIVVEGPPQSNGSTGMQQPNPNGNMNNNVTPQTGKQPVNR